MGRDSSRAREAKPTVAAIGTEQVQVWDGAALANGYFVGTSASLQSLAVTALFWEYRAISENNAVVVAEEVSAAMRDSEGTPVLLVRTRALAAGCLMRREQ